MKHTFTLFTLLLSAAALWAQPADNYYSELNGKSGENLFNAINTVAKKGFKQLDYDGLWTAYQTTDLNADGRIWDMYSNCTFTYQEDQCGTYQNECDCYNREHSIPKSWFCDCKTGMGADLFHLVPTDGKVNGMRSNYAFGEVASATYSYNNSKRGTAQKITIDNTVLGSSYTTTSVPSTVFEPADEYKGDFARGYFGAMIKWTTDYDMDSGDGVWFFNNTYTESGHFGLADYGIALLLKWHRQDPVSQKELDRNNGIQTTQGNRNPFIDYPCLAEYIWGNKAGETVDLANLVSSYDAAFADTDNQCGCLNATDNTGGGNSGDSGSTGGGSTSGGAGSSTQPAGPVVMIGTPIVLENVKQTDITCTGTTTLQLHIADLATAVTVAGSNENIFTVTTNTATNNTVTPDEAAAGITITLTKVAAGTANLTIKGGVVNQTIGVKCQ